MEEKDWEVGAYYRDKGGNTLVCTEVNAEGPKLAIVQDGERAVPLQHRMDGSFCHSPLYAIVAKMGCPAGETSQETNETPAKQEPSRRDSGTLHGRVHAPLPEPEKPRDRWADYQVTSGQAAPEAPAKFCGFREWWDL